MDTKELEVFNPKTQITQGTAALNELRAIIATRPDKLVINNKQYLFYTDWQLLAAFFGINTRVTKTQEIMMDKPSSDGKVVFEVGVGFHAWAEAYKGNQIVGSAEAECMFDEQNWKGKARFAVLSMAQTRACAKALRNCIGWVVRLPVGRQTQPEIADDDIADGKK